MATDRLSIDKSLIDTLIKKIDSENYLGLGTADSQRIDLFLFAMAIGLAEGRRTPLKTSHGFILETAVKPRQLSMMNSVLVNELRKTNEEEKITDKEMLFKVAEEYANTGFQIIQNDWMKNDQDAEERALTLLNILDDKYDELFGESI
jgi:hypothetical protein